MRQAIRSGVTATLVFALFGSGTATAAGTTCTEARDMAVFEAYVPAHYLVDHGGLARLVDDCVAHPTGGEYTFHASDVVLVAVAFYVPLDDPASGGFSHSDATAFVARVGFEASLAGVPVDLMRSTTKSAYRDDIDPGQIVYFVGGFTVQLEPGEYRLDWVVTLDGSPNTVLPPTTLVIEP